MLALDEKVKIFKPILHFVIGTIFFLVLVGCGESDSDSETVQLPSGNKIKILGFGKMYQTPKERWFLMLKYETNVPLDDKDALREEALEVWSIFKRDVENTEYEVAAVSANEPPKGNRFINSSRMHNFAFYKQADGSWTEDDPYDKNAD